MPSVSTGGFFIFKTTNMAYKLSNFLANVESMQQKIEEKDKKEKIGLIVHSLQRPFQELMTSVVLEQQKQVDELINSLGWQKILKSTTTVRTTPVK
jgi:hypothetical protein